jgi:hypothetical protein
MSPNFSIQYPAGYPTSQIQYPTDYKKLPDYLAVYTIRRYWLEKRGAISISLHFAVELHTV